MEDQKDINKYDDGGSLDDYNDSREGGDEEDDFEDDEDDDQEILNEEEQMFLQQQIENEFMQPGGEDDSDDGLVLAGEGTAGIPPFNQMNIADPNLDINFQKLNSIKQFSGWIQWFISLQDHDFLLEIDRDFITDKMNLLKIRDHFPNKDRYKECMRLLLSAKVPNEEDLQNQKFLELNQDTSDLYCIIHNRYVQSPIGLAKIYSRYLQSGYGTCPRALCDRQKVLPLGLSDKLRTSRVKVYCPCCEECFLPKYQNINLDGFFFGSALPHIFMKSYPQAIILPPKVYYYQPKIFGFKVFGKRGSKYYKPATGAIKYIEDQESIDQLVTSFKEEFQKQRQQQLRLNLNSKEESKHIESGKTQQSSRGKKKSKKQQQNQ